MIGVSFPWVAVGVAPSLAASTTSSPPSGAQNSSPPADSYHLSAPPSAPTFPRFPAQKKSPLLQQSQSWLRQVQHGLRDGVERVGSVLDINRIVPDFVDPRYFKMTYQAMLMAIPSGMDVAVKPDEKVLWHDLWREAAAMMHLIGRRLLEEGHSPMAMALMLRAEALVLSLEDRNREEWAALIRREIVEMPAVHEYSSRPTLPVVRKTLGLWRLESAMALYAREMEMRSPTDPIEILSPPRPPGSVSQADIPTAEMVLGPFESAWREMGEGRTILLEGAVDRVFKIYNPAAITMLDQVVRVSEAAGFDKTAVEILLSKAIRTLDAVLQVNRNVIVFRMKIGGMRIDNVASRTDAMLVRWGGRRPLPEGVEVYYELTSASPR